jgi:probable rRNA maturation factor
VIDVESDYAAWSADLPDAEALAQAAAELALEGRHGDVAVLLTSDEAVRDLNARFRGKDAATNVLSFPAPVNPDDHLGDIALAHGVIAREAAQQGKPLAHHLQHLVIHGVLHLIGYDHERDEDAERMEALERTLLARLGIPDPSDDGAHVES